MTTKICIECQVDLVLGENWIPSNASIKKYLCQTCHHSQVAVNDRLKANAAERLGLGRGTGGGTKWMVLPLGTRQRELATQREIEANDGFYTPRFPKPKVYMPGGAPKVVHGHTARITRPGQSAFRKAILARDYRCVVTTTPADTRIYAKGLTKAIIQAAHIKPLKLCSEDEYWDLDNGLAMRVDIHAAFDHGLFTIGDDGEIIASRWMQGFYPERVATKLTDGQRQYLEGHRGWTMGNWSRWAFDQN